MSTMKVFALWLREENLSIKNDE